MEIWINFIQGIGIIFFEIICCRNFFSSFFEKRNDFILWQKISLPLLSVLVYFGALIFNNNILLKTCYTFIVANYAQTECQFRYCGTAIPFLTVRSTAR